jgi:hypothetical protein
MRRIVCLAAVLALTAAGAARAQDKDGAAAVIDKAIKAVGGEAKIAKYKAQTFKAKGTFYGMGEGIAYTGEWAEQGADKMRAQIEADGGGGMKFTFVRVVNGDKVWMKFGDDTQEVTGKDEITEAKEELYADWITTLLPLKEKGFELAPLGEVKVNGKPAVGVRVSHKGYRDINLFFDKDTGLLAKSEHVVKDPMAGGNEQSQETLFSEYKEIEGVKHAMKVVINRDGKKYIESEVTEFAPKEKIDDAVFGKP